ncbi:cell division protein SepF [Brochothrix campestris]|uniref:Cell division protein SepF n=1 Tax=Brochothrix campestris FSL F6-1037 TaxID=1265861 RepID=W7CYA3_9LIST|nr:cell division protein SepF [Brochothrix campestris]EUJ41730.1 hypothetical protein BCAMP_02565 [Brochothrix campestris FSL F6-1037]
MSMLSKVKDFFYLDEEEEFQSTQSAKQQTETKEQVSNRNTQPKAKRQAVPKEKKAVTKKNNVVRIGSETETTNVTLHEPRIYSEVQAIADDLLNRQVVVVNLQRMDKEQSLRMIDFLSGNIYAVNGEIKRLGNNIFLCAPENISVDGAISEYINNYDA